ncbi:hypothetical protein C8J56DRAFT_1048308 [Mycena floridula]|nr:hypothetical protein C8J56DRAFT_1048308 [Mycena floridula]
MEIQLVSALHSPIEVVLKAPSTALMNFVASESAYALFPQSTFDLEKSLTIDSFEENLVDKASFSRVGWTLYDTATLWEVTNPSSEWCAGSRSLGDHRCWVQKLPKIDHTVVLDAEMWFNPRARESLYADSWALAYHETGITTNVFSLIKYQGDMSNFCITAPSFKDDWLMTWKDVNRKYGKDSTNREYLMSCEMKVTLAERRELDRLIATAGHEVLEAIRDQLNSLRALRRGSVFI